MRTIPDRGRTAVLGALWLLATAASPSDLEAQPTERLNGIIARAERGDLIFEGEAYRMMPDQEHDLFGLLKLQSALEALRPPGSDRPVLAPVLRMSMEASDQEKHRVKQYLDAGIMGLILSQVRTPDEVLEFVQSMRYPPQPGYFQEGPAGRRGWSPTPAAALWGLSRPEYTRKADLWPLNPEGELLAIAMIETREGVENIAEILEVPGLGAILVGTADLSMSYGIGTPAPPDRSPVIDEAIERIARACDAHRARGGRVICGRYQTAEGVDAAVGRGFTMFTAPRGS